MRAVRLLLCWLALLLPALAMAQSRIANTATLRYAAADGSARSVRSNTVALTVERAPLPSRVLLRALPSGLDLGGARCGGGGLVAAPLSSDQASAAPAAAAIDPLAGFAVLVEAPGNNRDPAVRETLTVTIAAESGPNPAAILLTETTPDSGVFAGAVPPAGNRADLAACAPILTRGERVAVAFAGGEGSLPSSVSAWVDPAGIVFDSADGTPVDGAEITLLDDSGNPARVLGDDGVSTYPATVTSGAAVRDAGGQDYPAVHGRYRFPLVATGRYRLRIVPPAGYTAPSRAAPGTLAAMRDPGGRPFLLDAASTGGVLSVVGPKPVLTDIPVDRPPPASLLLTLAASLREASPGDVVQYRLHLTNRGTSTSGPIRLPVHLPPGLRYRTGTLHGGAAGAQASAATLDVTLPALDAGGSADLDFLASVAPGAAAGEAIVDAQAFGTRATSNAASAAVRIRPLLFTDALTILGRVTIGGCDLPEAARRGVAGARVLLDDGSVAITDRQGLYHLEGVRAGRHVVALDAAALPGLVALDCAADTRSAGSATSRFVEGMGGIVRRVDFQLREDGRAVAATPALPVVPLSASAAAGDRDWLAGQTPGIAWLFPAIDYNPRAPVTRVAIKHLPGQRVALTIDGRPVDPLSFDATDGDGKGVAVSRWVGIPLAPGVNRLAARVLAADGSVAATIERSVIVSGPAHAAAIDLAHSRLVADGTTPPLVAIRVTDAHGRPVHAGTLVGYAVAAPYAAAENAARPGQSASAPVVGDDGVAFLALRPTSQAGAVRLTVALDDGKDISRPVPVEAWLTAAARGWTVVGFGAGSIGRDVLARHAQSLPLAQRGGRVIDGELSLYAKGRIKGAWLLTLAYDSGRRRDVTRGIGGLIDPDRYYTVYGDTALQGADAATQRKLYLRLEMPTFLALFGDTDTGFIDTQLTRYSRTVEGLRAEYRGRRWHATAFAARPDTLAGRDEIQGNGLTGPYRLRAQHIVTGSDRLRIEVRDRLRSEVIVTTTPLARHLDYDIDPVAGTLRFASPVLSRDPAGNPVFIVAEYEIEGGRAASVAGARVVRRIGKAVEIGASVLRDATLGDGRVAGGDVKVALGTGTVVRGEVASGGWHGFASGTAFLAEAEHRGAAIDVSAYVRQQDAGFGLGQQNLAEAGTRKIGADLRWRPLDGLSVSATAWHQRMLAGPGERLAGQARIDWTRGPRTLFVGAQFAQDTGLDGGDRASRLLTLGARQVLAGGALTVEGQADIAPGGVASSVDFPARRLVTATWRVSPGFRLIGGYEIDAGSTYTAHSVRAGVEVMPWSGATASAAVGGQAAGEGGQRRFVQYGLNQSLPLGPRWSLDATLDSARTVSGAILPGAMVTPFQPVAAAGAIGRDAGDFTAAGLGASYRDGGWAGAGGSNIATARSTGGSARPST